MNRWSRSKAILVGGAIGGPGDILFAIGFAAYNGTPPVRLLQIVASGGSANRHWMADWRRRRSAWFPTTRSPWLPAGPSRAKLGGCSS